MNTNYKNMWEAVGSDAGKGYLQIKFQPTYRIGLTNYVREQEIFRLLEATAGDKVLDVGCASGRQIFRIAPVIAEGHGVDIAQSFVDRANQFKAEQKLANTHFAVATIESLPFADGYFNKVICGEVLEHVFEKDVALNELSRVLTPGGALIISVPNMNADATLWGRFLRLIRIRKFTPMTDFSHENLQKHGDSHVREFTKSSMTAWLQSHGLQVESIASASWIDGPYFDFLLKVPLHIKPWRELIIWLEKLATRTKLPLGRHLVLRARKC